MTTRERWIVYPLLMFSLMMGIKTRYFQDTFMLKAEKIECGDLTVGLINGRPARLTAIIPNIEPARITTLAGQQDQPAENDDDPPTDDPPAEPTGPEQNADQPNDNDDGGDEASGDRPSGDESENSGEATDEVNPPDTAEANGSGDVSSSEAEAS